MSSERNLGHVLTCVLFRSAVDGVLCGECTKYFFVRKHDFCQSPKPAANRYYLYMAIWNFHRRVLPKFVEAARRYRGKISDYGKEQVPNISIAGCVMGHNRHSITFLHLPAKNT